MMSGNFNKLTMPINVIRQLSCLSLQGW